MKETTTSIGKYDLSYTSGSPKKESRTNVNDCIKRE